MRIFNEMPAKYIVREVDTTSPKYRIRFYRNMPTSDVHYAWVVGGEQFSRNIDAGIESKSANPQPIPTVNRENDNFVIEISKHEAFEWHLNQFVELGERFAFLETVGNHNAPYVYIPLDRLELESYTTNLSKNT